MNRDESDGSPSPRRIRSPSTVPSRIAPVRSTSVRKRYSGPSVFKCEHGREHLLRRRRHVRHIGIDREERVALGERCHHHAPRAVADRRPGERAEIGAQPVEHRTECVLRAAATAVAPDERHAVARRAPRLRACERLRAAADAGARERTGRQFRGAAPCARPSWPRPADAQWSISCAASAPTRTAQSRLRSATASANEARTRGDCSVANHTLRKIFRRQSAQRITNQNSTNVTAYPSDATRGSSIGANTAW